MWEHFKIKKATNRSIRRNKYLLNKVFSLYSSPPTFKACKNSQFHLHVITIFLKNNLLLPKFSSRKFTYPYYMCNFDILQNKHWRQQSRDLCTYKCVTCSISSGQLLWQQSLMQAKETFHRQQSTISLSHLPLNMYVRSCVHTHTHFINFLSKVTKKENTVLKTWPTGPDQVQTMNKFY